MSKQQPMAGPAASTYSPTRILCLALGLAAAMAFGLWLLEPAVAAMLGLAIAVPAALAVAVAALHTFGASRLPLGRGLGRPDWWLDSRTGLMAEPALAELGEPLLQRCQRRDEPLAVLVFDFEDLGDVQELYGIQARRELLGLIGRGLRRLAGRQGLALRVTQGRFVVLLPGCTAARALKRAATKLGVPCSFELDADQHELVLVPRLTALCATAETDSIAQLLRNAQPQPARRPTADSAWPTAPKPEATPVPAPAPMSMPKPVAPSAAKPQFELPDNPDQTASYPAYPATFPMPLASAARRSSR